MKAKICTCCGLEKDLSDFHINPVGKGGRRSDCRGCACAKARNRTRNQTPESRQRQSEWRKKYDRKPSVKNRKKEQQVNRIKNDIAYKLRVRAETRIHIALSGMSKSASALHLLGCSQETLKQHMENQFTCGMSFENYGEWHMDHIAPVSSFDLNDPEQQRECFHFTNLQPLWAKDNFEKGGKLPDE
mgnify:CR=1 FL=1